MTNLVVIDCETTGLGRHDRVVEIAAVTLDSATFEIIDEYDTLINPERDVGPVNIHGISASMVEAAPNFQEIAAALGSRLDNAILVAHNLSFDSRMLLSEYQRLGGVFDPGRGICTLSLTGEKLIRACERFGIDLAHQHRALADARATAALLPLCTDDIDQVIPACITTDSLEFSPRTLRRDAHNSAGHGELARIVSLARYPSTNDKTVCYLDMLDWVLDDLFIDNEERLAMADLARQLGLSDSEIRQAHETYAAAIVAAAHRDGVVTERESAIINRVALALDLDSSGIVTSEADSEVGALQLGQRVCFTGTAVVDGVSYDRHGLEALAAAAGLQPVKNVSKKGCDILVAADTSTMSGKAKKARDFGIPVISVVDFLKDLS